MKQIKRMHGGRINGRYFRTTVYIDGSAFGVMENKTKEEYHVSLSRRKRRENS